MNKEQILAIILILALMSFFGYVTYLGLEDKKLADECRFKYGGDFRDGTYCHYIEDGNSKIKYMLNDANQGDRE